MWWLSTRAFAATLDVGLGYPYATITDAVADAVSGDVIDVHDPVVTDGLDVDGIDLTIRTTVGTNWQVAYPATFRYGHLTLEGFDLGGGYEVGFDVLGSLTLVDVVAHEMFSPITVSADGPNRHVVVTGSTFHSTHSPILVEYGVATALIEDSLFDGNTTQSFFDHVVSLEAETNVVRRSTFVDNDGDSAIAVLSCVGHCTIEDSMFSGNFGGDALIWGAVGDLVAERNLICNNDYWTWGLWFEGAPSARIRNNGFLGNGPSGYVSGIYVRTGVMDVSHNDILSNFSYDGSIAALEYGLGTWKHNLVAWNGTAAGPVAVETAAAFLPSYSFYNDNLPSDTSWNPGPGEVSGIDPELPAWAFGLCTWEALARSRTSPLRNAGDPLELDPDGTPVDIGALGGPGAPAVDADADGSDHSVDCDDLDPLSHPGAVDTPLDGVDQDCDGVDSEPTDTGLPEETGDTGTSATETADTGTPPATTEPTETDGGTTDGEPEPEPDDEPEPVDGGCGCGTTPPAFGLVGLLVAGLVRRRRTMTPEA